MTRKVDYLDNLIKSDYLAEIENKCIIANGCFDVLHPGHLYLLETVDFIANINNLVPVIALNSDKSIKMLKGFDRPFVPEDARAELLICLKWPFFVVIFDELTPQKLMNALKPKFVVKGSEYAEKDVIKWEHSKVISVKTFGNWSTTNIMRDK